MKKITSLVCLLIVFAACNNTATTKETPDTTGIIRPGIENVNGNLPDTTNSIQLSTVDSSARRDSASQ